jgi:transposase-like protein
MPPIGMAMEATAMEAKRTRRHLSEETWREVFERFAGSGESVTRFCKREGLHTSSFQRWRQRLSAPAATQMRTPAQQPREANRKAPVASFIEMGAVAAADPAGRLEVRLDLGGGLVLQLVRS